MPEVPYLLSDMAADAVAVLDDLGDRACHVVGASLGGMIVQTMAIEHPERVRTLTSIMSTTGEPAYYQSVPEVRADAVRSRCPTDRDGIIAATVERSRAMSSPRYFDAEEAARAHRRGLRPLLLPGGPAASDGGDPRVRFA